MTHDNPFELERFVVAQDDGGIYERAIGELRRGHKTSHWMWFVFPQIAGLGQSTTSRRFAISTSEEARSYLHHEVLGPRLIECTRVVAETDDRSAAEIFGPVDAKKLHSSMTLFIRVAPDEALFGQVLDQFFDGIADVATDRLI